MLRRCVTAALVTSVLVACGSGSSTSGVSEPEGLRVAAFDFAESELLAELYAQAIEGRGIPVDRLGAVGPREIVAPALQLGHVDLVVEYVGTAARHHGASGGGIADLRDAIAPSGLLALEPSSARDTNVLVVTWRTADAHDLSRVSDLAPLAPDLRFGGPVECPERPLCLRGLDDVYGIRFGEFVPQLSLQTTAAALERDEIDVGLLFSTSAVLVDGPFVVLEDDRGLQPADDVVPVVRADALERWGPEVRAASDAVSAQLSTGDLRALNRRVEEGDPVPEVAADWLADRSLLGG